MASTTEDSTDSAQGEEVTPDDFLDPDPHDLMPMNPEKARTGAGNRNRLLAMEKSRQAMQLRMAGATYAQIGQAIGLSESGAHAAVQRAIKQIPQEDAKEMRSIQLNRINYLMLRLQPQVDAGDLGAINTFLRLMDKQDRLLGTEAPQQIEHSVRGQVITVEGSTDDYINALKKMAAVELPDEDHEEDGDILDAYVYEDEEDEYEEQTEEQSDGANLPAVLDLGVE